jgi:hypothetical protein
LHSLITKKSLVLLDETLLVPPDNPDAQKAEGTSDLEQKPSKLPLLLDNSAFTKLLINCNWLLNPADEPVKATP